jgi:hypothetical protein
MFVSLFAIASAIASVTTGAGAQEHLDVPIALDFTPLGTHVATHGPEAPADMSFGIYPLSVFGIENAIKRADARADEYASGVERFDVGPIAYSVVAIHDWERRYPSDPWIPKELLGLCRFYVHVGTSDARDAATHAANWLRHDYPSSAYARAADDTLANQ